MFRQYIKMVYVRIRRKGAARRRKLTSAGGLRGTSPALMAAKVGVTGAQELYKWSKTSKGLRGFKRNQRYSGINSSMLRSNDSGYIKPHFFKNGTPKTSLSFSDKLDMKLNPPNSFSWNTNGKLEANSGTQNATGYTVSNTFFNTIFAEYPNLRSEGSGADTVGYSSSGHHTSLNHRYTSITHTFMNSSNLTAELSVYTYKSKLDIDSGDQSISAASSWSYSESINNMLGSNGTNDSATGTAILGKAPTNYSAKQFISRYWGLIDKVSVTMKPGESFRHNGTIHLNRILKQFYLHGDNSACVKDHCLSMIFVVRGQVVGSSASTAVSTGDAQISYIRTLKMGFCTHTQSKPRDVVLTVDTPPIASANQIFINTDTSVQTTAYVEDA